MNEGTENYSAQINSNYKTIKEAMDANGFVLKKTHEPLPSVGDYVVYLNRRNDDIASYVIGQVTGVTAYPQVVVKFYGGLPEKGDVRIEWRIVVKKVK